MLDTITTYGTGGYDPTAPGGNVAATSTVPVPVDEQNRRTLQDRAVAALAANGDYLALTSPTAAQSTAQVKALTRQVDALIRLALGRLDATD